MCIGGYLFLGFLNHALKLIKKYENSVKLKQERYDAIYKSEVEETDKFLNESIPLLPAIQSFINEHGIKDLTPIDRALALAHYKFTLVKVLKTWSLEERRNLYKEVAKSEDRALMAFFFHAKELRNINEYWEFKEILIEIFFFCGEIEWLRDDNFRDHTFHHWMSECLEKNTFSKAQKFTDFLRSKEGIREFFTWKVTSGESSVAKMLKKEFFAKEDQDEVIRLLMESSIGIYELIHTMNIQILHDMIQQGKLTRDEFLKFFRGSINRESFKTECLRHESTKVLWEEMRDQM